MRRRAAAGRVRPGPGPSGSPAFAATARLPGTGVHPAEDHPARAGLEHAGHRQPDRLAQVVGPLLGDDHGAVVEVAHALARLLAPLEQLDDQGLSRQDDRLHRVGQVVEVDHVHALEPRDLVEVVVVGDDLAAEVLGQDHQPLIDLADPGQLGDLGIVDPDLDPLRLLEPVQDVQASTAAVPPQLVRAVRDPLQLLQDEPGDHQRLVDHPRLRHVGDPPVDHHRGVQHQRPRPLHFLGEFHVGDDESEVVLGLEQRRDAHIADEDHQEAREHHVHPAVQIQLHRRSQRLGHQIGQEDAHDDAEIDGRDRLNALAGGEEIGDDHGTAARMTPDEDDVGVASWCSPTSLATRTPSPATTKTNTARISMRSMAWNPYRPGWRGGRAGEIRDRIIRPRDRPKFDDQLGMPVSCAVLR